MKLLRYLVLMLIILLFSCILIPKPDDSSIKGIYSIGFNGQDLQYSDIDSINFEPVSGIKGILNIHYFKNRDLLLASSRDTLYFINTQTNEILSEINIPRTSGLDGDIVSSFVYMFPYPENENYCILCNSSIFLINLNTYSIEEIMWNILDAEAEGEERTGYQYSLFMHGAVQSPDGNNLYIQFLEKGFFQIGGDLAYLGALKNHLMCFDVAQDSMYSIIDYPLEDYGAAGSKYIYCNSNYVLPYDPNKDNIIIIPSTNITDQLVRDTIYFDNDLIFFSNSYSGSNFSFIQYPYSGSFYEVTNTGVNLYMEQNYTPSEMVIEDSTRYGPAVYGTTYQTLEGGDVYACIPFTTDTTAVIVNLSRKTIIKEFKSDFFQTMLIVEKER